MSDINEKIVHAAPVPPFVTFVTSAVPMVFDNSLSYYEALSALWKWMQDNLVNVVNNNASVTEHYIELTNELKEYVENYFTNLDVQEEINNKLDQMAEDGELADIIAQYLGLAGVLAFATVADMKNAENLVNGSSCRTAGYHIINDGGDAYYRVRQVTNADVVDEGRLIALHNNQLVAELITSDVYNVKQFGAYGDGTHDDTTVIQNLLNSTSSGTIYFPIGRQVLSSSINFCKKDMSIKDDGVNQTFFIDANTTANHYAFTIDNFPIEGNIPYVENNSYKDFSIIANEHTNIGLYINGTAHCKYENIHVHNVPNTTNTFAIQIRSQVCSYENVSQPENVGDENYTYAYYGLQIERVNRPNHISEQATNNVFNKCIIEDSTYNLLASYSTNNTFISCAIENATTRDITISSNSRYNVFIGCGTELAATSLQDDGMQSTFINCYMLGSIILNGKGVFINGGYYASTGPITIMSNSYGIIQNIAINHDGTSRNISFGSYNYRFTNVFDEATNSYVYCYQPRTACTLDANSSWTNTTNKTVAVLISGDFSQVTTVEVKYPGANAIRCMQPANILTPGGNIRITSNGTFSASYTPIE